MGKLFNIYLNGLNLVLLKEQLIMLRELTKKFTNKKTRHEFFFF